MKTIFRYTNMGLLLAAMLALGAVATLAEDPCADAEGQGAANEKIQTLFKDKSIAGRKAYVEAGKAFLEKYGKCESAKDLSDYLTPQLPKIEETIRKMEAEKVKNDLIARFDNALKTKNWDEAYAAGKEILSKYPEELRVTEIVLGAIGGEEAFKGNFKHNDDALRFAKQSIADLEGGKSFVLGGKTRFGLSSAKDSYNFEFLSKDDALGYMNFYIGYMTAVGQKNKAGALPYLYKASQAASESAKQPVPFELIGNYYFDELNKLVEKIQTAAKDQKDTDAPDVAQKKVDDIKALVALSNGTSERAMDAFSRAYTLAKPGEYKNKMKGNVEAAYNVRFGKKEPVDTWIASAVAKPFINPQTPVAPVSDPEPIAPATPQATMTTPGITTPGPAKPGVTTPGTTVKTVPTTTVKQAPIKPTAPATKPGTGGAKPQATVKNSPARKKAA